MDSFKPHLILASASPRRQELLRGLNLAFDIAPSAADEFVEDGVPPHLYTEILAERKARDVAKRDPVRERRADTLIVGADTIVVMGEQILGKPRDEMDAVQMLMGLQGRPHTVYTGLCVLNTVTEQARLGHCSTTVHMRSMTADDAWRYVRTGEPMDKAGSYAIQGYGATLITRIEGDYFNVVGLPLWLLRDFLHDFGVSVF